jgi:hypothetical protein
MWKYFPNIAENFPVAITFPSYCFFSLFLI